MMYVIIIVILLILSAFFSSSETILFLAKDLGLKKQNSKFKYIYDNQEEFLTIILFSNTIVNIFLGMIFEYYITNKVIKNIGIVYVILSTTLILLIFGEILPKRLSLAFYEIVYEKYFNILILLEKGLRYVIFFFNIIIRPFKKIKSEKQYFTYNETKNFLYDSYKNKVISDLEFQLFYRILNLKEIKVSNIMIPYTKIEVVNINKLKKIIKSDINRINKYKYDYVPVYDENYRNILGVFDVANFFKYLNEKVRDFNTKNNYEHTNYKDTNYKNINYKDTNYKDANYKDINYKDINYKNINYEHKNIFNNINVVDNITRFIIKPVFVYIEEQLDNVIRSFDKSSKKIAVVVDQYFQFKGIVKYSDLINYFLTLDINYSKNEIEVNPLQSTEELKYFYGINLPAKYKNLHEFLVPYLMKNKKMVKYHNVKFKIVKMNNNQNKKNTDNFINTKKKMLKNKNVPALNYKVIIVKK